MKKALAMLVFCLSLFVNITLSAQSPRIHVREERLGDATVAFTRRYPRIDGLRDTAVMDSLNRRIRQLTTSAYLGVRQQAKRQNSSATGSVDMTVCYQSQGLLCLAMTTQAKLAATDIGPQTDHFTFSLQTGKRLYFWDLFVNDGAKRRAVTQLFAAAADGHSAPDSQWALTKPEAIDTLPFWLSQEDGTLCVALTDGQQTQVVSLRLDDLSLYLRPGLIPE